MGRVTRFRPGRRQITTRIIWAAAFIAALIGYGGTDRLPAVQAQLFTAPTIPAPIEGRPTVVDGDTIVIAGERIRINYIDAPEGRQTCKDASGKTYRCGAEAARALDGFLSASRPTRCEFVERDRYGRFVGNCFRSDGASVAEWMVRNGHALDFTRYSNGFYASIEVEARNEKRGVWRGSFEAPWDWRAAQAVVADQPTSAPSAPQAIVPQQLMTTPSASPSTCSIKGNISAKGERIYHIPGQEHYARTRISEAKGERWFCTEADARNAGWRKAKR